jgi:hypothetical protein
MRSRKSKPPLNRIVPPIHLAGPQWPTRAHAIGRKEVIEAETIILVTMARNRHPAAQLTGTQPNERVPIRGHIGTIEIVDKRLGRSGPGVTMRLDGLPTPNESVDSARAEKLSAHPARKPTYAGMEL